LSAQTGVDGTYRAGGDVHANKIQAALYRGNEESPLEEYENQADTRSKARLLKKLQGLLCEARCVYEAGTCGCEMHR
jgi:hypothetical protein